MQALSGIACLSGDADSPPVPAGFSITDMMAGAQLAQGILALPVRRGVTGQGGRVDVSLLETAIDLQFEHLAVFLNSGGKMPHRSGVSNGNIYLGAPYGIYATADGYIAQAMAPIDRLGLLLNSPPLLTFARRNWFADRDRIKAVLRAHLAGATTRHWLDILEPAGIWAAPVLRWHELMAEPAFEALAATQKIRARRQRTRALEGSWFPDAFVGPMANLQRYAAGDDSELRTSVEDAWRTMALIEAGYLSNESKGTPVPQDRGI